MISKIIAIRRDYENKTLKDGVVVVLETKNGEVEQVISGTEWSTRFTEKSFGVLGVELTKDQIVKINNLFGYYNQ